MNLSSLSTMLIILWEYHVKPENRVEFETRYSPKGGWAEMFHKSAGYLGTELIRSRGETDRYITIDRWTSMEHYEAFLSRHEKEYSTLDDQSAGLTESESLIGIWDLVPPQNPL